MPDEGGDSTVDMDLLMMVMETRELLEEAQTEAEVEDIRATNRRKFNTLERLFCVVANTHMC